VAANGQALDPGTTFPQQISALYAVFRPDLVPPGMQVNVATPTPTAYYAYLKVQAGAPLSTFGWRWSHQGQVVNEYVAAIHPGQVVWLERFDPHGGALFGGDLGPGTYTIDLLLDGNPAMRADLVITP
jgi:hypothetical protein